MINIRNTTLFSFCWGEKYFEPTIKSMVFSKKNIDFSKCLIATDIDISKHENLLVKNNIHAINIHTDLNSNLINDDSNREKFSSLFIEILDQICDTDYILTIQQDSGIIFPEMWTDDFFDYDYIGAPWPMQIIQSSDMVAGKIKNIKNVVGNGGFSLRSKKYVSLSKSIPIFHKNEDLNLCIFNYETMVQNGIKFAPPELAIKFSVEHPIPNLNVFDRNFLMTYNSFGFHGAFNTAAMRHINNEE